MKNSNNNSMVLPKTMWQNSQKRKCNRSAHNKIVKYDKIKRSYYEKEAAWNIDWINGSRHVTSLSSFSVFVTSHVLPYDLAFMIKYFSAFISFKFLLMGQSCCSCYTPCLFIITVLSSSLLLMHKYLVINFGPNVNLHTSHSNSN